MGPGDPGVPADALVQLADALGRFGIRDFALTEGVAVGVWSSPRQTRDLDACAVVPGEAVNALLARFDGVRAGAGEVPDVIRLSMRVVTAEDLTIHKLIKLCADRRRVLQDAADLRAVVEARSSVLDGAYLRRWLPPGEAELIERLPELADDELVRRLLAL